MTLALTLLIACSDPSDPKETDPGADTGDSTTTTTTTPVACDEGPAELSGMYVGDLVLLAGCTYEVHEALTTTGLVTVEPGVEVVFDDGLGWDVQGGIDAEGTSDAPIRLHGASGGTGTWPGISLASGASHALRHVVVDGAGYGTSYEDVRYATGALLVVDGATALLDDVTITRSTGWGLDLEGDLADGSSGIHIADAAYGSVLAWSESMLTLPPIDTDADIFVDGIGESRTGTWVSQPVPLRLQFGDFGVESGTLTIEPNTLFFGPDTGMIVGGNDPADLVTTDVEMDASDPAAGWRGIEFLGSYSAASTLKGGRIANGAGPELDHYDSWIQGVVTISVASDCSLPTLDGVDIEAGADAEACVAYASSCSYCPAGHFEGEGPMNCGIDEFYYVVECGP